MVLGCEKLNSCKLFVCSFHCRVWYLHTTPFCNLPVASFAHISLPLMLVTRVLVLLLCVVCATTGCGESPHTNFIACVEWWM